MRLHIIIALMICAISTTLVNCAPIYLDHKIVVTQKWPLRIEVSQTVIRVFHLIRKPDNTFLDHGPPKTHDG
jgi:hypothetical protein